MKNRSPRTINHCGISVTNLKEAIKFYTRTFGFKVLKKKSINTEDSSMEARIFKDIFEGRLRKLDAAWLNSGNRAGLEIFEFVDPKAERLVNSFDNWRKHFSHICITDPNIEDLCERIKHNGGVKHSDYHNTGGKDYRLVYCKDPFGNFIELFTKDYRRFITGK